MSCAKCRVERCTVELKATASCRGVWKDLVQQNGLETSPGANTVQWDWFDCLWCPTLWVHGFDLMDTKACITAMDQLADKPCFPTGLFEIWLGENCEARSESVWTRAGSSLI
jgi:hypothetical protein